MCRCIENLWWFKFDAIRYVNLYAVLILKHSAIKLQIPHSKKLNGTRGFSACQKSSKNRLQSPLTCFLYFNYADLMRICTLNAAREFSVISFQFTRTPRDDHLQLFLPPSRNLSKWLQTRPALCFKRCFSWWIIARQTSCTQSSMSHFHIHSIPMRRNASARTVASQLIIHGRAKIEHTMSCKTLEN